MSVFIDPVTRQRVVYEKHSGDIVYQASTTTTTSAVYNETKSVVGNWNDYTGSANVYSPTQQQFAGITNQLQGTVADVEAKAKLPPLNEVGEDAQTTRRRVRLIYVECPESK